MDIHSLGFLWLIAALRSAFLIAFRIPSLSRDRCDSGACGWRRIWVFRRAVGQGELYVSVVLAVLLAFIGAWAS
jgi:hypothetical protein